MWSRVPVGLLEFVCAVFGIVWCEFEGVSLYTMWDNLV